MKTYRYFVKFSNDINEKSFEIKPLEKPRVKTEHYMQYWADVNLEFLQPINIDQSETVKSIIQQMKTNQYTDGKNSLKIEVICHEDSSEALIETWQILNAHVMQISFDKFEQTTSITFAPSHCNIIKN